VLFKLGEGDPLTLGIKTADVVDGFYSFLGFPRLLSGGVVQKAIARGTSLRTTAILRASTAMDSDWLFPRPNRSKSCAAPFATYWRLSMCTKNQSN